MKMSKLKKLPGNIYLICLALFAGLPITLVLINSFKTHTDIVRNPLSLSFSAGFKNYIDSWIAVNFSRGFINSIIMAGSTILIVLFCSTLAAYVIASKKVKGTAIVMLYFLVAMTIPVQLFLFPLYSFYAKMKLIGNLVAVSFILAAVNLPISISLLRAFFVNIPKELEEAARIDGANTLQVLRHIMIPMVSPGLITVSVIVGLNSWNEYLISSTFLQGEDNFTAVLSLASFKGVNYANQGFNMAASIIMIVPVIVFFLFSQRYFIDGIVGGSVKG